MKVKIIANNSGKEFYDRYIGQEFFIDKDAVSEISGDAFILMKSEEGYNANICWEQEEYEIIVGDITISLDRYNELLEIEAMYNGLYK